MSDDRQERRQRRRARRRADQTLSTAKMRPIAYRLPVYELLDEDGLDRLHQASMRILSEFGIDFLDEEVRAILRENGAQDSYTRANKKVKQLLTDYEPPVLDPAT
jgi:trimethylamine--corrinoid protein Co-methyltransferase